MKGTTRIKVLSVVFVVLAILAWFTVQQNLSSDTIKKEENPVAIEDTASIKKVVIERNGNKEVLSRTSGGWMVNNKYRTSYRPTALLLLGLNQLQIKRPVSEESRQKVYDEILRNGETVTIEYGEGNKVLKFITNENDINTTYLLTNNSKQPYIAYVPGISNDINNLFRLEEKDWRDKELFASSPRTVKTIKVSYPQNQDQSFEMEYRDGKYSVKGVNTLDSANFSKYLPLYQYIPVSSYLTDKADSVNALIAKMPVYAKIEVMDLDPEKSNYVDIYTNPSDKSDYLGKLGKTGEPVLLKREIFDQLLVKKGYFIKR